MNEIFASLRTLNNALGENFSENTAAVKKYDPKRAACMFIQVYAAFVQI